jgi:hypothetical protein
MGCDFPIQLSAVANEPLVPAHHHSALSVTTASMKRLAAASATALTQRLAGLAGVAAGAASGGSEFI